jgi:hypothetical protein
VLVEQHLVKGHLPASPDRASIDHARPSPIVRRSVVLYGLFIVLLIAGWHELPSGDAILPW